MRQNPPASSGPRGASDGARPTSPAGRILTWVAIVASVILPFLLFEAWQLSSFSKGIITGLQAVEMDPLRGSIVAALVGALGVSLVCALITRRPFIVWTATSLAYAALFALLLPHQTPPQVLPHQSIDQVKLWLADLGVVAMGVAAAAVGTGIGRALRAGAEALARLRFGVRPSRLLLIIPLVLLGTVTVYGLFVTHGVLVNGPWVGVVKGAAPTPNPSSSAEPVSAARQLTFSYHSAAFGTTRQAIVMLPAGYDSSPTKRYPVLYLLHGSPGSVLDWPQELGAAAILASAEQSGAPPMIMVSADGNGPTGGSNDSWADGFVPGENMASDLLDSLLPAVDKSFRTIPNAAHRGIGGLSTGAYGAANLALQHPDLFGTSIVLSLDPMIPPSNSFGGNVAQQNANDPLLLAQNTRATTASPIFFVGWGTADDAAAPNSTKFISALQASGYTVYADAEPGGHDAGLWQKTLYNALVKVGPRLA